MAAKVFSQSAARAAAAKAGVARRAPRAVAVRAEPEEAAAPAPTPVEETVKAAADAAWEAEGEVRMQATVVASAGTGGLVDPADGSIAEGAPLGNDFSLVNSVVAVFKNDRAIEMLNGRAAMLGFTAALYTELTSNKDLLHQVANTRTFTLYDGTVLSSTYPSVGAFSVPLVVLLTLVASLAPVLKNEEKDGLIKAPNDFGPFKVESEILNGRAAMVGLFALHGVEKLMGNALF